MWLFAKLFRDKMLNVKNCKQCTASPSWGLLVFLKYPSQKNESVMSMTQLMDQASSAQEVSIAVVPQPE